MRLKKWVVGSFDEDIVAGLSQQTGHSSTVCRLLYARGLHTAQDIEGFLRGEDFFDPFLIQDMDRAVERIRSAVAQGETITIFGDFDCDGITSTALLYQYLESVGADVNYYIPQREEGYGLSMAGVELMHRHGTKLIITVDNGISAAAEVAHAATLGLDVVITDHHRPPEELPKAVAVVNPHRTDCPPAPYVNFAGVGVVFKLICALEGDDGHGVIDQYGDLVALGTLADVVELSGENRLIVQKGLEVLQNSCNPGLCALMQQAGIGGERMTSTAVTFGLSPRINAAGRMGDVDCALELLLCEDEQRAAELAAHLGELNNRRKEVEDKISREIDAHIAANPDLVYQRMLILWGKDWHQGVMGIVASKMTERFGKPCLLISVDEQDARGSGRSVEDFSLIAAIAHCGKHLTHFGGHPGAAGLSMSAHNITAFYDDMLSYCAEHYPSMPTDVLQADCTITPEDITVGLLDEMACLEPFGEGNPSATFVLENCTLQEIRPVGEGRHLNLRFNCDGKALSAMMFHTTLAQFGFEQGDCLDVAAQLSENEYAGERRVTIKIVQLRHCGVQADELIAQRQMFESLMRGEHITDEQSRELTPDRDRVATVYRNIKAGKLRYGCDVSCSTLRSRELTCGQIWVAVEVLLERGLVQIQQEQVIALPNPQKTDLLESVIYQKINNAKLV